MEQPGGAVLVQLAAARYDFLLDFAAAAAQRTRAHSRAVSQTSGFLTPMELTDGSVSNSESRDHAKTSNGGQESGHHARASGGRQQGDDA